MGGTGATLRTISLGVACVLLMGQQRRPSAQLADPAKDLVRTRIFLTSTAPTIELSVDGAALANAEFTVRRAVPSLRATFDRGVIAVSGNLPGFEVDLQIDAILAGVTESARVGWNVVADGPTRLEILNGNAAPVAVDTFELTGGARRFETRADLLRTSGPLAAPRPVDSRLVLAFFYPWWNLDTWDSPIFIDRPVQLYSTESTTDLSRVMTQAKNAGLDALVVSWSGKAFDGGIDNRRMLNCLAAAQTAGIKIATLFETPSRTRNTSMAMPTRIRYFAGWWTSSTPIPRIRPICTSVGGP